MSSPSGHALVVLQPFAADAGAPLRNFTVRVARPGPNRLLLEYALAGDLAQLRVPQAPATPAPPGPTDGLWRHTCMELFVGHPSPGPYLEYNFATSGHWAAYRFSGYRAGMAPLTSTPPPRIAVRTGTELLLEADLELPADLAARRLRLAVTAVVEDTHGQVAYWAQRHAPGRPDFHHPDSFVLEI